MNTKIRIMLLAVLIIARGISLAQEKSEEFPILKGPYLGQKRPGMKPEVFAPGIISTDNYEELCSGFLDNGRVFIFSRLKTGEDWKKCVSSNGFRQTC
jgi:hypothetical protein